MQRLESIKNEKLILSIAELKADHELIKEIQARLNTIGMYGFKEDDPDGLYGPRTETGIEAFCDAVYLDCADTGLFGPSFAKALLEYKSGDNRLPTWWVGGSKDELATQVAAWGRASSITDRRQLAYIMATIQHETASTYKPIAEYGGRRKHYAPYYGRGYVQLTWKYNYEKYSAVVGEDLVNNPDLAMRPDIALYIIVDGMKNGVFTGKRLNQFINSERCDYINARRIINGTDRADLVASYAKKWEKSALLN
ncbi:MAG: glycoside hydrolase family 19 protein [Snowella sp.]|nr:glycoside hydrolase family 19 protein [Snowella sp.]